MESADDGKASDDPFPSGGRRVAAVGLQWPGSEGADLAVQVRDGGVGEGGEASGAGVAGLVLLAGVRAAREGDGAAECSDHCENTNRHV